MQPYKEGMFFKVFSALLDEGIRQDEMAFEEGMTFVSDKGFFTLIFTGKIPQIRHFLVWESERTWHNVIRHYREMKALMISLGFVKFVVSKPTGDNAFWPVFFKVLSKNMKKYAEKDGQEYYIATFERAAI